jgi:hypothetical protein
MTTVSLRILAFAAMATMPLLAQQPTPNPQPSTSSPQQTTPQSTNPEPGASEGSNPQATPVPSTANSPEVSNPQLRPVTGELESKLDTKEAKSGDAVVVKTTEPATIANGVTIPKGSEIKGHVVDVASKAEGGDNSRLTIQFDQAQLKSGQSLAIRSVIQSVAPAGTASAGEASAAGGPPATVPTKGNAAASSSGATGAAPASGGAQAENTPAPGTVVATKGNLAIKTTSIPGVLLIGDVNGRPFSNASGALLGAKQDVHLDNGTVVVVAIMSAPPAVGAKQ